MRVGSWNVNRRVGQAASVQGSFLRTNGVEVVAIQEGNTNSVEKLCEAAGFDWFFSGVDVAKDLPKENARRLSAVIAGKGPPPIHSFVFEDVPFPERTMVCDFGDWMACSFHAPPGVSWGILKPRQAVAIANWLQKVKKPIWFGIDANTPEIDHPNFDETHTHWHTGRRRLKGEPGDDVLVASSKIHELNDAFRVYLSNKNKDLNEIIKKSPNGPLAVSHRTGKRKGFIGNARRYDAVWISGHFGVEEVIYLYEESVVAGSDHALVVADLQRLA